MEAIDYQARLLDVLKAAAYETRPCRFCGVMLFFVTIPHTGRVRPYTAAGRNHFEDCPQFQRQYQQAQPSLFPPDPAQALD